jgi:MFS family permease
MMGVLIFGPLLFGLWLMFKGVRDREAWRIIRVIWFFLGLGLFAFGLLQGAVAAVPWLQAIVEVTDGDEKRNENPDGTDNRPPIFRYVTP